MPSQVYQASVWLWFKGGLSHMLIMRNKFNFFIPIEKLSLAFVSPHCNDVIAIPEQQRNQMLPHDPVAPVTMT